MRADSDGRLGQARRATRAAHWMVIVPQAHYIERESIYIYYTYIYIVDARLDGGEELEHAAPLRDDRRCHPRQHHLYIYIYIYNLRDGLITEKICMPYNIYIYIYMALSVWNTWVARWGVLYILRGGGLDNIYIYNILNIYI